MADLSDGFIAMPGGLGTLEELLEIATWSQLGLHQKPIGLLDVAAYFKPLLDLLDRAVAERFLKAEHRGILLVEGAPGVLLERLDRFHAPPAGPKWIDRDER